MGARQISNAGWGLAIGLLASACAASPQATSTPVPAIDPEANSNGAMYLADLQHSGVFVAGGSQPVGELKWTFATDGEFWSSPAIAGGVGYFASTDGNLYAVDLEAGQEKWRLEIGHLSWSEASRCSWSRT